MAQEFLLPDIGEGLAEAEIVRWLIRVGDEVGVDDPLVEIETDKAVVEIPSPFAGTVLRHGAAEGQVLAVGSVLAVIGSEADPEPAPPAIDLPPAQEPPAQEDPAQQAAAQEAPAPIVGSLSQETTRLDAAPSAPAQTAAGRPRALPLVRKLARELGVDLARVEATGEMGRITREDVQRAASATADRAGDRRPMSRLRRTIAANMARSWAEIPHATTFDDAEVDRLLAVRSALARRHNTRIPLDALIMKAVTPVVQTMPEFNASIDGDDLVVHPTVDMGLAVDTPDGLMVAVVRAVEQRSILDLAAEVERLGAGARARTLTPAELSGQSFTVSNIGAVGGGHGTPIIPPGTTAILSVGRATGRPVVRDGTVGVATLMPLSLSFDHRVIDGALGRRFMAMVMENLAEPALFLV